MPGYPIRETEHPIDGHRDRLRLRNDTRRFAAPDGRRARIGILLAHRSGSGRVRPCGCLLHCRRRIVA